MEESRMDDPRKAQSARAGASAATRHREMVSGLFTDWRQAESVYGALTARGYKPEDINVIMSDETRQKHFGADDALPSARTEPATRATEGVGIGSAIGGATGAIAAALAVAGTSLALPGVLVILGPLAAAFAGAGVGGITGGLLGALVASGLPEERVEQYEEGIRNGGILMTVYPRSAADADYFEREWKASGALHVCR